MRNKKIWVFNAGHAFSGNPKWLFLYMTEHCKDMRLVWLCYQQDLVDWLEERGIEAYRFDSAAGIGVAKKAGVFVVDQCKEVIPESLAGAVMLNLWHGVGCKTVELGVTEGFLARRIAKKHIKNKLAYKRDMLFLVTSEMMERHFRAQCDIDEDKLIRAGYPCCVYDGPARTYDHDFLSERNLPQDTRVIAYAPTYRDNQRYGFMQLAIPDMRAVAKRCEEIGAVFILKLHPQMADDPYVKMLAEEYADEPRILFWDNQNDFYEVMSRVDVAVVDYSSIFYDMLYRGVRRFVRYSFDYEEGESMRDFVFDYLDNTCGEICLDFDSLLDALGEVQPVSQDDLDKINERFWSYSDAGSLATIVERTMAFEPDPAFTMPTLFSFDLFDTLIGRTSISPDSVFLAVRDKLVKSGESCPEYIKQNYPALRQWCENNVREYMVKSVKQRDDDRCEITLGQIFERMVEVYGVSPDLAQKLMDWEIEVEKSVTFPYRENIETVKGLVAEGETVILVSDMYLPGDVIRELLRKADPALLDLPLYLSSEWGHQKKDTTLYLDIYHSIDYRFSQWVHVGDNPNADVKQPKKLAIEPVTVDMVPELDEYEQGLRDYTRSFDAYQVSGLYTRFRENHPQLADNYAYSYVSAYFVPYINWVLRDALKRGTDCLYFISRDGDTLKLVADAIIAVRGYEIKTKLIYGSRKAWRVPSQVDAVDDEFFGGFGNFVGVHDYESLMTAAGVPEGEFLEKFPAYAQLRDRESLTKGEVADIREELHYSSTYHEMLLEQARKERDIVSRYLVQEIDFNERYAFVEYWGRGYTQTCLSRIIDDLLGEQRKCEFYYLRSIYPTYGNCIRHNFTTCSNSLLFLEALLANVPYASVSSYVEDADGTVRPDIVEAYCHAGIKDAVWRYLPQFARDYASLDFVDEDAVDHAVCDYGLTFYKDNRLSPVFLECHTQLRDSVDIYGNIEEYAPKWTVKDVVARIRGVKKRTSDSEMSMARSGKAYRFAFEQFRRTKGAREAVKKGYKRLKKLL